MIRKLLITFFIICIPFIVLHADGLEDNTYETAERLFHIARSANKNLVCYDINLVNGELDSKNPLKVYWVNREERPGETNGLSYIQRKLAYGYKLISSKSDVYTCSLTAYPDRKLTVTKRGDAYVCLIKINNEEAQLKTLYVKAKPHNPLSVEYVELHGISLETHQPVCEKIMK